MEMLARLARRGAAGVAASAAQAARAAAAPAAGPAVRAAAEAVPACAEAAEQAEIPFMGGVTLRKAVVGAEQRNLDSAVFWRTAARRATRISKDVKHWDAVAMLQCFARLKIVDEKRFFHAMAESLENQLSQMAPKHIFDAIAAFEGLNVRPKNLYTLFFRQFAKILPTMYPDEQAALVTLLARHEIKHPEFVRQIACQIANQNSQTILENLKFPDCCEIAGALGALEFPDSEVFAALEAQVKKEVALMRPNEIFHHVRQVRELEFSWKPFEEILTDSGLQPFIASLVDEAQIDQVTKPVELFCFLRFSGKLDDRTLTAFAKWALAAARRLKTRYGQRIALDDLLVITDLCNERHVAVDIAKLAVEEFEKIENNLVVGLAPVQYARRRRYIRKFDAYVSARLRPAAMSSPETARRAYKQSPGQWLTGARRRAAWLNFTLPWYYNR